MALSEQINNDLKIALKERQAERLSLLRNLNSKIQNKRIELKRNCQESEIRALVRQEVKQQTETKNDALKAGRQDIINLADRAIKWLEDYLPQTMPKEEAKKIIKEVITSLPEDQQKNFGKIMSSLMPKLDGRLDGQLAAQLVKEELA